MFGLPILIFAGAIVLELSLIFLSMAARQDDSVTRIIVMLLLSNCAYLLTATCVIRRKPQISVSTIIGVAAILRITVSFAPAPLSWDIYRYRWEAQVVNAGGNPYVSRPVDAQWLSLRDETWPRVGQKDVPAGYGPAWTLLAGVTGRMAEALSGGDAWTEAFWFRTPAMLFEFATLLLLAYWIRGPMLLLYAWCPLPVFEFWASGHNDAPVLFCLVLALFLAQRQRWAGSWTALSFAIALKLWPAILIPAWLFRTWPRVRDMAGVALAPLLFAAFAWPFWADIGWNVRYMSGFVGGWRNNDSLFGLLLWAAGGNEWHAKCAAFALIGASALWFATRTRQWPLTLTVLWTVVALLLLASNCHPWYLAWFAPLLVFYPEPALLAWIGLMPVTYVVWLDYLRIGVWNGSTPVRWVVFGPVLALLVWRVLRSFSWSRLRIGADATGVGAPETKV